MFALEFGRIGKEWMPVGNRRLLPWLLAAVLTAEGSAAVLGPGGYGLSTAFSPFAAYAMEAPGAGGENWHYDQKGHHWYYYDEDGSVHTGWLYYEGEWYWFDQSGWMVSGGPYTVSGVPYYFYSNGHMAWNQYVDLKYYDGDGLRDEKHDIRVVGTENPTSEDRDLLTDYLYAVPRSWLARFHADGWQLMFYKKRNYFAAPSTGGGIYYVYHSMDTHYKKVKFTRADAALQAFGEYVGYVAGCYREGSAWMEGLWKEFPALGNILEIPDYYSGDPEFYFGKVFAAYLDDGTRDDIRRASPDACRIMEEILYLNEDEETKARRRERMEAERQAAEEEKARAAAEEGYGPGVPRPEE